MKEEDIVREIALKCENGQLQKCINLLLILGTCNPKTIAYLAIQLGP